MVKKLMKSIGEYKKDSILAPVYVSLEVVMEVLIPLLMANLIDYGIDGGNMPYILKTGIILVVAAALSLFFGVAAGFKAASPLQQVLPKICASACMTMCKPFLSLILTTFLPPALLPGLQPTCRMCRTLIRWLSA